MLSQKWLLKLPSEHEDLWSALTERAWADLSAPMLVNTTGNNQSQEDVLLAAGFVARRRIEELWRIPVAALVGRTVEATCIAWCRSIGATSRGWLSWITPSGPTFLARKSWRGSLADLSASMADDTFDPELYLIAEDTTTGSYDGLIRVWNRAPLPRLGCLGVRGGARDHRDRRCQQWFVCDGSQARNDGGSDDGVGEVRSLRPTAARGIHIR